MTDTPAKPSDKRRPSKELAFRIWLNSNRPSMRELEKVLADKGWQASHVTLSRWSKEHGPWATALTDKTTNLSPERVLTALEQAIESSKEILCPEIFEGIKIQLVARLYESMTSMRFESIEQAQAAADYITTLNALIHAERGKAVDEGQPIPSADAANGLVARLNPPIKLAAFKKNGAN